MIHALARTVARKTHPVAGFSTRQRYAIEISKAPVSMIVTPFTPGGINIPIGAEFRNAQEVATGVYFEVSLDGVTWQKMICRGGLVLS